MYGATWLLGAAGVLEDGPAVVELQVQESTWHTWVLPVLAIAISFGTLAWSRLDRWRDQARFRVRVRVAVEGAGPFDERDATVETIRIVATNVGKVHSRAVQNVYFVHKKGALGASNSVLIRDTNFNTQILPGEIAYNQMDPHVLASEISRLGLSARDLKPEIVTGNKRKRGRWSRGAVRLIDQITAERQTKDHQ